MKVTVCWEIVPTHLTHLSPRSQSKLKGKDIPSNPPLGVRVEEKKNPVMLHVDHGPLSAGPFRPCVQQVLSRLERGGMRHVSEREASKGIMGWEEEGREPGSRG